MASINDSSQGLPIGSSYIADDAFEMVDSSTVQSTTAVAQEALKKAESNPSRLIHRLKHMIDNPPFFKSVASFFGFKPKLSPTEIALKDEVMAHLTLLADLTNFQNYQLLLPAIEQKIVAAILNNKPIMLDDLAQDAKELIKTIHTECSRGESGSRKLELQYLFPHFTTPITQYSGEAYYVDGSTNPTPPRASHSRATSHLTSPAAAPRLTVREAQAARRQAFAAAYPLPTSTWWHSSSSGIALAVSSETRTSDWTRNYDDEGNMYVTDSSGRVVSEAEIRARYGSSDDSGNGSYGDRRGW